MFAVVIPTCDRPAQLAECLTSLTRQTYPRSAFEVIVVDDGSTAPIAGVVAQFSDRLDIRLIRQPRAGPAAARNCGIAAARANVLAFTDDDCCAAPDWLERLDARFQQQGELLVGGCVTNALDDNVFAATSQLIHDMAYAHHNTDGGDARFFATNNLAVSAEPLVRLGGFDPAFRVASEDRDFCARWHESGRVLAYAPDAKVSHAHRLTFWRFCAQHFRYGRGAWRFHRALRRRGRGRFVRDLGFHARFLRRAGSPLSTRNGHGAVTVAALLLVWQIANLAGFAFEAVAQRLPSEGPAAKIT
jgi:GT2 family glycosyltransferase